VHAFRTAPSKPINAVTDDLGPLGGNYSSATTINRFGQVVGVANTAGDADYRLFLYNNGVMHDLNNLIPASSSCRPVSSRIEWSPHQRWRAIAAEGDCDGQRHAALLTPIYKAFVQEPINGDGSSVFNAKRTVLPVKFRLTQSKRPTCSLLPATIALTRFAHGTLTPVMRVSTQHQQTMGRPFARVVANTFTI